MWLVLYLRFWMSCLTFLEYEKRPLFSTKAWLLQLTVKPTHQEETDRNTQTRQRGAKRTNKQTNGMANSAIARQQDRNTVTDCRGTDQQHTKSRGKPRRPQQRWREAAKHGESRERLSLFILDGNTEPSKASFFLLHCNKHTDTKGRRRYCI